MFGPQREAFLAARKESWRLSALTSQVASKLSAPSMRSTSRSARAKTSSAAPADTSQGFVDAYLFQAMQDAGVTPADPATDFEFIRRVTLDLTGRIPTPERVMSYVNDSSSNKKAALVDELIAKPESVDKWTMYFGDLFKNQSFKTTTGTNLYPEGRNAFYKWIKDSVSSNKPYDQVAREIIAAEASNTWDPKQGVANWGVLGRVTGGPVQDTQDQIMANVAETFLGLANENCLECHDGRRHLDSLNLWGKQTTRYQAWQMAAFVAHTPNPGFIRPDQSKQSGYWNLLDNGKTDYQLNTTTGNRPPRMPVGNDKVVAPVYIFNGHTPGNGEKYRAALAREVTGDFQFARASVNYIWKEFFGRGLVEPANQFDPARLDPDNPPTDPSPDNPDQPWPLQASNPRLLNELAQRFIDNGYDLQWLMRQIANSDAYGLSSRYNGDWNPLNEPLFARKLVRRLWAEEIHDAIAQSSWVIPTYKVYLGQDPNDVAGGTVNVNWAMQFPEPRTGAVIGGTVNNFLDAFLRGNRDDNPRRTESSLTQALGLMNDSFVMTRIKTANAGAGGLINYVQKQSDGDMVTTMYLNVLSRLPNDDERQIALTRLGTGDRKAASEDLLWSLYNKVDFIFNY
jgi:hypothetical protein